MEIVEGEEGEEPDYELDDDPSAAARLDVGSVPITLTVAQVGRLGAGRGGAGRDGAGRGECLCVHGEGAAPMLSGRPTDGW